MQALIARLPLASVSSTVQAPQSPSRQASLLPVRPRSSRNQSSTVRLASVSATVVVSPFRRNVICMGSPAAVFAVPAAAPPPDAA